MPILGFCQKNFLTWEDAIEIAITNNLKHIEFSVDFLGEYNSPSEKYLSTISKKLDDNNLTCSFHCVNGINLSEKIVKLRNTSIDIMKETVEMANELNAKWITTHLGSTGAVSNTKRIERLQYACESIKHILTSNKDVRLNIENLEKYNDNSQKSNIGSTLEDIEFINSYLSKYDFHYTLDIGHLFINNTQMEIEKIIESMLPRINMLHIHTNDRKNDLHSGLSTNNSIIKKILLPHLNDFTDKYMLIECYSIMEIEKTAEILQKIYF